MAKKVTVIVLALILVAVCCACFAACDPVPKDKTTIVYIGDSIAEALIGPSPLAERDNYGYYAVVGKANGMRYFNHSVSGHKTSTGMLATNDPDDIGGLLGMLYRNDENAALMKTHLQQADIIHISVLGNNILQYNLGLLFWEIAQPDFDDKFNKGVLDEENGKGNTLIDLLYRGSREKKIDSATGEPVLDENGRQVYKPFDDEDETYIRYNFNSNGEPDPNSPVYFDFPPTYQDLKDAIARIRELNPDATIIFQTVYNPFYEDSVHLKGPVIEALKNVNDKDGNPISTIEQYRAIADKLLDLLNDLIQMYIDECDPQNFYKLDVNAAFAKITNERGKDADGNVDLSSDCYGRRLIYADWTHPSNFGHAVIACETQALLEQLGYADKNALANYKSLRLDQLERLYTGVQGVDIDKIKSDINSATSFYDVTFAYFDGTYGATPINY